MTNAYTHARASGLPIFSIHGLVARIENWNDVRRTRKVLSGLTARELDDIGLVRGDIERIAKGQY